MQLLTGFTSLLFQNAARIFLKRGKEVAWARKQLLRIEQHYQGQLDLLTFDKIANSYAVYVLMFCHAFTRLHGRGVSEREKVRLLHYFICSSLFDDFCDRDKLSIDRLEAISFAPQNFVCENVSEKIFQSAHLFLLGEVSDIQAYDEISRIVYRAQVDSDRQFDKSISDDELREITMKKGGYSVLLSAFYLDTSKSQAELNCWLQMGYIIQLTNDLFDIYKDIQSGSQTLAGRITDADRFHQEFESIVQQLRHTIHDLDAPEKRKRRFYFAMMSICSFGTAALHQLMLLQQKYGQLPALSQLPQRELIVDMEKWKNIKYCIQYTYRQYMNYA